MPQPPSWSVAERQAWAWIKRKLPSDWCESAPLFIPDNALNPEPGPYTFDRTPYWRGILDDLEAPDTREMWVYKGTQVGFTRLMINWLCWSIDQDPGGFGLLMPDEDSVAELFAEELKPTIDATPALRAHKTGRKWDSTTDEIWLDTMPVFGLYAGSVQKLARRSLRRVAGDEINKYRPFKSEASPIRLLMKRTSNWLHRARHLFGSTPTTPDGNITLGYESCPDKRTYWIPCHRCGFYQVPVWSQVKGFKEVPGRDKFERANHVKLTQPAYYECANCKRPMTEPGTADTRKAEAVAAGVWASQTQTVVDGKPQGERPRSAKIGVHLWSFVSPWLTCSDLAAEFIESDGDLDKSKDFRNSRLALPWEERIMSSQPSIVRDRIEIAPPAGVVPKWAVKVYATWDVQKDWFAGVVRAWGYGLRSQLVWYGIVRYENFSTVQGKSPEEAAFDEVYRISLQQRWPVEEDKAFATANAMLIDSGGDRTDRVYQFAQRDHRIYATKGIAKPGRSLWFDSTPRPGVRLRMVDTNYFKGALHSLLHDPDRTKWMPHRDVPEQYCLEMASESLIVHPNTRRRVWVENGTARNEAWDCEVLQRAAAEMDNLATAATAPSATQAGPTIVNGRSDDGGGGAGFNPAKPPRRY